MKPLFCVNLYVYPFQKLVYPQIKTFWCLFYSISYMNLKNGWTILLYNFLWDLITQPCHNLRRPWSQGLWWIIFHHYSDIMRLDCLLNRLFRRRSKKAWKLRVTGLCEGNPPVTGGFPHIRLVKRKMFPFDDVIMISLSIIIFQFVKLEANLVSLLVPWTADIISITVTW